MQYFFRASKSSDEDRKARMEEEKAQRLTTVRLAEKQTTLDAFLSKNPPKECFSLSEEDKAQILSLVHKKPPQPREYTIPLLPTQVRLRCKNSMEYVANYDKTANRSLAIGLSLCDDSDEESDTDSDGETPSKKARLLEEKENQEAFQEALLILERCNKFRTWEANEEERARFLAMEQGSEEWLKGRKLGIGGSEIGAICGACPQENNRDKWSAHVGLIVKEKNPLSEANFFQGHLFEDVAKAIGKVALGASSIIDTGITIDTPADEGRRKVTRGYFQVSLDGTITYPEGVRHNKRTLLDPLIGGVEVKSFVNDNRIARSYAFGTHALKAEHLFQMMYQMSVAELPFTDYFNFWHFSMLSPPKPNEDKTKWLVSRLMVTRVYRNLEAEHIIRSILESHVQLVTNFLDSVKSLVDCKQVTRRALEDLKEKYKPEKRDLVELPDTKVLPLKTVSVWVTPSEADLKQRDQEGLLPEECPVDEFGSPLGEYCVEEELFWNEEPKMLSASEISKL